MDRRAFFSKGVEKAAKSVTKHAVTKARKNAVNWIRPPFAIDELDFLLACSRCDDCVKACPHNIIFLLPAKLGAQVFSTPAMDLNNHGCHLCEDWPCVQACETNALTLPIPAEDTEIDIVNNQSPLPLIARVSIIEETCLPYSGPECGACRVCPVAGAMTWIMEKPSINTEICTGCALCREACIVEPKAIKIQSKYES